MNTSQITLDSLKIHALVYGGSGTYKTRFSGTFPEPYFFDFDGGMLSLRDKNIEFDTYEDLYRNGIQIKSAAKLFNERLDTFDKQLRDTGKILFRERKVETIVIDSVTTLQSYMLSELCALNNRPKPTLNEWGLLIENFRVLFNKFNKWPIHVIVVAHEEMVKDEITGEVRIRPLIVGKALPNELPMYFDEVYRSVVIGTEFKLLCKAGPNFTAKSRLGGGILDKETPDFAAIMEKVKGGKK